MTALLFTTVIAPAPIYRGTGGTTLGRAEAEGPNSSCLSLRKQAPPTGRSLNSRATRSLGMQLSSRPEAPPADRAEVEGPNRSCLSLTKQALPTGTSLDSRYALARDDTRCTTVIPTGGTTLGRAEAEGPNKSCPPRTEIGAPPHGTRPVSPKAATHLLPTLNGLRTAI
jgi:hypothetical protein